MRRDVPGRSFYWPRRKSGGYGSIYDESFLTPLGHFRLSIGKVSPSPEPKGDPLMLILAVTSSSISGSSQLSNADSSSIRLQLSLPGNTGIVLVSESSDTVSVLSARLVGF